MMSDMRRTETAATTSGWTGQLFEIALMIVPGLALAACQLARPATAQIQPETTAQYNLTLKPDVTSDGTVEAIEVSSRLTGGLAEGEETLQLMAPIVYVNVTGIADRITGLEVSDANGPVTFATEDDEPVPGGYPYFRHWTATREVTFPVEISYRALIQPEGSPGGPAFGIRPSAGGISGAGAGFMIVPSNAASTQSVLAWDLSEFDAPSVGVTTFGEGKSRVDGPPANIMQGWYMAGPTGHYPEDITQGDFHAYWLGDFPFDEYEEMAFTAKMYDYFETYFDHLDPAPEYRVFMRLLQTPPYGGGTALANSFMLSRGPVTPEEDSDYRDIRSVFVHELLHQWVGFVEGGSIDENWFSEGLTTYYQYTLPFRAGEISFDDYLEGLNRLSRNFYTNKARDWSISEIKEVGFGDGEIRHVPYQRGALYFADLDSRLRAASGGAHGLHDFMSKVFRQRESGEISLTPDKWRALVSAATGEDETAFHNAVHVEGKVLFPASDSFGRCVKGVRTSIEKDGETYPAMQWEPAGDVAPSDCFVSGGSE
ncbi:M61 family metallopeptidase [Henriciella aquimarina]|uniref:M61 family metallopeptidase n=1 Tax=Henriciella aquimarina TaxID=545261 RepID=UPI0009FC3742|nr:hypothetical protein [Henriciella aquimarina]